MSQTLLAVGAVALLGLLALQTQRDRASAGQNMVNVEVEAMTGRVATDALDALRALPFDAAIVAGPVATPAALTAHRPLGSGPTRFDSLGARRNAGSLLAPGSLDAMDGRLDTLSRTTPQGQIQFAVETVVGYVTANAQAPSATPSVFKMASVRVRPLGVEAHALIVSQLYACGNDCVW